MTTVNISVIAEDWQATAAEFAGENMRLRAAIQAAGRELSRLATEAGGESIEDARSRADDNSSTDDENRSS